ncbi:hypothetical protein [Ponticaulis koreensis]|uniref:hypothetical protein n=1 Tax=Ponticaulis koreensis TaxID=1123045 RepID=UPI0012DE5140|nr:hypothetical protein [Ponticaulis koreensis]
MSRSVRDNMAIANPSLSMDDVIRAAELAGAHDFILELPNGYDAEIEERSGNQSAERYRRLRIEKTRSR